MGDMEQVMARDGEIVGAEKNARANAYFGIAEQQIPELTTTLMHVHDAVS